MDTDAAGTYEVPKNEGSCASTRIIPELNEATTVSSGARNGV
jgi:hypothetical protein